MGGITKKLGSAGITVPSSTDIAGALSKITDLINSQVSSSAAYAARADASLNLISPTNTTAIAPYDDHSFFVGKKFSDGMCQKYSGDVLNSKCKELTAENCNLTDCCTFVGGKKCMAGNENGPTYTQENGRSIDYTYYSYKNKCYGACGAGQPSANPCSEFGDENPNLSYACLTRLWAETGCPNAQYITTARVKELKDYSKPAIEQEFSGAKAEVNYAKCYGQNENNWPAPCLKTTKTSTNLSGRCIKKLFKDSGCTNPSFLSNMDDYAAANTTSSKATIVTQFANWFKSDDEEDLTKCYGENESNWPPACNNTTDNSTKLSHRCMINTIKAPGCVNIGAYFDKTWWNIPDLEERMAKRKMLMNSRKIDFANYGKRLLAGANGSKDLYRQCYGTERPVAEHILAVGDDKKVYLKLAEDLSKPWVEQPNLGGDIQTIVQINDGTFLKVSSIDKKISTKISMDKPLSEDPWKIVQKAFNVQSAVQMADGTFVCVGRGWHLYKTATLGVDWTSFNSAGQLYNINVLQDGRNVVGPGISPHARAYIGNISENNTKITWDGPIGVGTFRSIAQLKDNTFLVVGDQGWIWTSPTLTDKWTRSMGSSGQENYTFMNHSIVNV
jgi:hypothetical protein